MILATRDSRLETSVTSLEMRFSSRKKQGESGNLRVSTGHDEG